MRSPISIAVLSAALSLSAGLMAGTALANDQLIQMSKDPAQWVIPGGNYASQRYSPLKQINVDNV
jgi:glucose dehydrogenase